MSDQIELNLGVKDAPADEPAPASPDPRDHRSLPDGPLRRLVDSNFLQYASYVIRDRAIPELDDGLKPVQRRILHSLHENDDGKFIKVANIVGYTMQFHPHGDASIGDALVTLVNRGYLVEGQGNFGNILTGDPAAAPRYIECRLTDLAREELFHDELTDYIPSYDGRKKEPVVLPCRIPLLLMLGADGIAVGLSTRILPHNFCELLEAQIAILQKKPFEVLPDFQQGGLMDASGYDQGRGFVRVRAKIEKQDDQALVIREIPSGTTTDSVIASIEDAARKGKLKLKTISDFTAGRVEIEVALHPEEDADRAVEALYAFTQCEVQLASRIVVIRKGRPVEMDVPAILKHVTERLVHWLERDLKLTQRKLTEEIHRKTLVQLFVENKVYQRLETCRSLEEAEKAVRDGMDRFRPLLERDITAADITMLLEIPVKRISLFDLERNRQEIARLREELAEAGENLANLTAYAIRHVRRILKKHGEAHPRRTKLTTFHAVQVREITASELKIGYDRDKGYLGHAVTGEAMLACSPLDKLAIVNADGRLRVVQPPDRLFVDKNVLYCGLYERDRELTAVYRLDFFVYAKRFTAGGIIMGKEYRCAARDAELLLVTDNPTPELYVRYDTKEARGIVQQVFETKKLPVVAREARGVAMTMKPVRSVTLTPPPDWDPDRTGPRGRFVDSTR